MKSMVQQKPKEELREEEGKIPRVFWLQNYGSLS